MKAIASIGLFVTLSLFGLSACAPQPGQGSPATEIVATLTSGDPTQPAPPTSAPPEVIISGGSSGGGAAATPAPPAGSPTPLPQGVQRTVTLAENGQTVNLKVGGLFWLQLGEGYLWTVTIGDEQVLIRSEDLTVETGQQGVYQALRAGTTTLSASGDPTCRQAQPPCGRPSVLFEVTVVAQ